MMTVRAVIMVVCACVLFYDKRVIPGVALLLVLVI